MIKRRIAHWLLVGCLIPLGVTFSGNAWAQDDDDSMSFGVDEVEEVDMNSPAAKFLAEGKKLYKKQQYPQASLILFRVLDSEEVSAEAFHPEAEYELGKALFRMELYQGALTYFGRVVDAGDVHPYYLPTLRGLVLLTEVIPSDQLLMSRLAAYADNFPQDVPKKYRDQFAYLVGRYLYSQGEYERALELFKYIKPKSKKYYLRGRYMSGVTNVALYDGKKAVAAFKDVLRPLVAKMKSGEIEPDERLLLEQGWLGMARVFYSTGDYNKSLKYYNLIPRESPNWPTALFESSWAYFQLDLANRAMGNLHTLNSPYFANSYHPEAPVLAGVTFFYSCKYPRVRYELDEFEYSYWPIKDEVEVLLEENQDPGQMFTWLQGLREGDSGENEQLERILAASLNDKQIQGRLALIDAIDTELEKLKALPSTWRNSPLGTTLVQDSTVAREFAINEVGELVQVRLGRVKDELINLNVDRERILFEVERAERGEIEAELRAEMRITDNVTDVEKVKVTDEQLYWTFDGEYWKDELGYYYFNVNSECKR